MTSRYIDIIESALHEYCIKKQCRKLNLKAALIDMDGVLYDSMPNHAKAWLRLCDDLNIDATEEEFFMYEGMTGAAIINLLYKRAFGKSVDADEAARIYDIKARYFRSLDAGKPMPGADRVLNVLREHDIMRVLVTGSGQKSLLDKLEADYPGLFRSDLQVTAHDVKHGKPSPEPYLMGQRKAHAIAQECIVIENAPLGVKAGSASGAFTLAVATGPIPKQQLKDAGADVVLDSMSQLADFLPEFIECCNRYTEDIKQQIVVSNEIVAALDYAIAAAGNYNKILIVTDETVAHEVLPALSGYEKFDDVPVIAIPCGDESKDIATLQSVWQSLQQHGATRQSVVINIGGGVVTDLGGFAASTFKRGLKFINVPTTLLCAVDAAVGGKTGINFGGFKNEIGVFNMADSVLISAKFFSTLPESEIKSGFAEMLKHALLRSNDEIRSLLHIDLTEIDTDEFLSLLARSVMVKHDIVMLDPHEQGIRKALNLGHTAGHAFESMALRRSTPIPHGYAVAWGLVVELVLSNLILKFDSQLMQTIAKFIDSNYRPYSFDCNDYDELISLMRHDKKSRNGELNFTLLRAPGDIVVDYTVEEETVKVALDLFRDLMHI